MDSALRAFVRRRAGDVCEYCRLPQVASQFARFHVEHIMARQQGGSDAAENLAVACGFCNFHKGPNVASIDPKNGKVVALFHPRIQAWHDHFNWQGTLIAGRTSAGRATARLLAMNDRQRVDLCENLRALGESFSG